MNELQMKMELLCIPADQVINGFCYAFSKALFEKLKMLIKENRIMDGKNVSGFAMQIMRNLEEQTKSPRPITYAMSHADVDKFVQDTGEFLAIFEKTNTGEGWDK